MPTLHVSQPARFTARSHPPSLIHQTVYQHVTARAQRLDGRDDGRWSVPQTVLFVAVTSTALWVVVIQTFNWLIAVSKQLLG
jgi:hypothetical protein